MHAQHISCARKWLVRFVAQLALASLGVLWCSTHLVTDASLLCTQTTRNVSIVFADVCLAWPRLACCAAWHAA